MGEERKNALEKKTFAEESTYKNEDVNNDWNFEDAFLSDDRVYLECTEEELKSRKENEDRNFKWKQNLLNEGYKFLKVYKGRGDLWGHMLVYCPKAKEEYKRLPINHDNCDRCPYFRCNIYGWKPGEYVACGFNAKLKYLENN